MAERRALEKSQRLAEGQLFRANDPRNNATTPRPPGTHWDDLPPTTEGMEHFATIFHIPPPGADGPATLDPEGLPTDTLNPPHGTVTTTRTIADAPAPPADAGHDADSNRDPTARPHRRASAKRPRSTTADDEPDEKQHASPDMGDAAAPQHTPVVPIDTDPSICVTPGCLRRSLWQHGPCCPRCPGRFGVGMGTPLPHPRLRQRTRCARPAPAAPTATATADADADPTPTHPRPPPAPSPQPPQPQETAPSPPQSPLQRSAASRRSPAARQALVTVAATVALSLTAPRAGAPRATARIARIALLASAAMSYLPATSSAPVPAPGDDEQRADDPPLTPNRTTGPTDLYWDDTDGDQHDQDDDQSDSADDQSDDQSDVEPPYYPIADNYPVPDEAHGGVLEPGLSGAAHELFAAFEEDVWYGVEHLGLADNEAFERALYNQRAILRGDPSLRPHMAIANDALARWFHDFGQGWIERRCYEDQVAWLRHIHYGHEAAEQRALEKSQRLAEGQLFRANDPRSSATTPRPPGTHWDDLPPTTEGMGYFATIFNIPPPGPDGPAALDTDGHPANTPSTTHNTDDTGASSAPAPPAIVGPDADMTGGQHPPALTTGAKRPRATTESDEPSEQRRADPDIGTATAPQHAPEIPTGTDPYTCTTPGCTRRSLFPHGACCPRCPGQFGVAWGSPCHTPGCDDEHAALALPPPPHPPPPPPTPSPTPTLAPTHPRPPPTPSPQPPRPQEPAPDPKQSPPQRSAAPRRSPTTRQALITVAATAALSLTAPRDGAPHATARTARRPTYVTLLTGALLAATTTRLPVVHSSPAPAPPGGEWPTSPTRPTTPLPRTQPPDTADQPRHELDDLQEHRRRQAHVAFWDGINDLGLSPADSEWRALALLEAWATTREDVHERDIHLIGHAFRADLRDAHLWDEPDSTANHEWLRQQTYVHAHRKITAMGGSAQIADHLASVVSRQTQDRREFHLHDARRDVGGEPWWHSTDLDWYQEELCEYDEDYEYCSHEEESEHETSTRSQPGAAAPHATDPRDAGGAQSTTNTNGTGAEPTDDGAEPDVSARRTCTQTERKRPRHGATGAKHTASDLDDDADQTTRAIIRHELEATAETATAAQHHGNDAPTGPAAPLRYAPIRTDRCPEHTQLFDSVCNYYTNQHRGGESREVAIRLANRMAQLWAPCSHCDQLWELRHRHQLATHGVDAGPEPQDTTTVLDTGAAAEDDGATAHPHTIDMFLSDDPDFCIIQAFQRRGVVDPVNYQEVPPLAADAAAAQMAADLPGTIIVVSNPGDPPGLAAVIATDALPDNGHGGPAIETAPSNSIAIIGSPTQRHYVTIVNPTPPCWDAARPAGAQPPWPPPTTPTPVPTPTPTRPRPTTPTQRPRLPATPPHTQSPEWHIRQLPAPLGSATAAPPPGPNTGRQNPDGAGPKARRVAHTDTDGDRTRHDRPRDRRNLPDSDGEHPNTTATPSRATRTRHRAPSSPGSTPATSTPPTGGTTPREPPQKSLTRMIERSPCYMNRNTASASTNEVTERAPSTRPEPTNPSHGAGSMRHRTSDGTTSTSGTERPPRRREPWRATRQASPDASCAAYSMALATLRPNPRP